MLGNILSAVHHKEDIQEGVSGWKKKVGARKLGTKGDIGWLPREDNEEGRLHGRMVEWFPHINDKAFICVL